MPWYRGAGAFSWAIINGEIESGVTLHVIDKDIDHGPVIDIRRFTINPSDTAESLFKKAEELMLEMFKYWIHRLLSGDITPIHQESGRIYKRSDLDNAKNLTRFVRAFTFSGKENCYFIDEKGEKIYLTLQNKTNAS